MAQFKQPETQTNTPPNSLETEFSPSSPAEGSNSSQVQPNAAAQRKPDTPVKAIRITDWASI